MHDYSLLPGALEDILVFPLCFFTCLRDSNWNVLTDNSAPLLETKFQITSNQKKIVTQCPDCSKLGITLFSTGILLTDRPNYI